MKLQNLAVMFICIVLPLSMILSSYTGSRVQTLELQTRYDVKLNNATADAVNAFQINTYNGDESMYANYKMEDIQAAVNTFYNSMRTNFSMGGYNNRDIQEFVPALVFTLYDGYYIYSPYQNTWDEETLEISKNYKNTTNGEVTYNKDMVDGISNKREWLYGLKPYIYYSCRYIKGNIDVVITYALDNYISIKGKKGDEIIDKSGYLLSDVKEVSGKYVYRGITIDTETDYKETVLVDGQILTLPCRKVNGTKYYKKDNGEVFHFFNGTKTVDSALQFDVAENINAVEYYKQALELKNYINTSGLADLSTTDAVDEKGEKTLSERFGDHKIFEELFDSNKIIEEGDSLFNSHRLDVIKYSVERNLSIAISNYNNYTDISANFQMPQLRDYEWENIANNISMISFLQGLPIGAKIYNGYSIVSNNKNQELVSEDSIYILTVDNTYHNIRDDHLYTNGDSYLVGAKGYYNINFERKSGADSSGQTNYYFPVAKESSGFPTGCYNSIVNTREMKEGKLSDILKNNNTLAKIYYTALGRERYGLYRAENPTNITESISSDADKDNLAIKFTLEYSDIYDKATIKLVVTGDDADTAIISYDDTEGIIKINDKQYECTKNGTYTFYAKSSDGKQTAIVKPQINGIRTNEEFIRNNVKPGDYIRYEAPNNSITIPSSSSGYENEQVFNTQTYFSGWRVLYNDNEHGLQIISADVVTGDTGLYLKGQNGYNNCVSILNSIASQYVNSSVAEWGRSVGSDPTSPTNDTTNNVNLSWEPYDDSGCKDYDNNYVKDLETLKYNGMTASSNATYVWLASRMYEGKFEGTYGENNWFVRTFSTSGRDSNQLLFSQNSNGGSQNTGQSAGVRSVIKLKDGIKIVSGSGTPGNEYIISP